MIIKIKSWCTYWLGKGLRFFYVYEFGMCEFWLCFPFPLCFLLLGEPLLSRYENLEQCRLIWWCVGCKVWLVVGFCKLNENLSSFYLMQLSVILNVLMSLRIDGVVEFKDSDVEQCHHYCSFCACCHVYYMCCLV